MLQVMRSPLVLILLAAIQLGACTNVDGDVGTVYEVDAGPDAATTALADAQPEPSDGSARDARSRDASDLACGATADVMPERKKTTAWLVVDSSSSMFSRLWPTDISAWDGLRSILLDSDGLVPLYQDVLRFGLVLHVGGSQELPQCPLLHVVPPALRQANALGQVYAAGREGLNSVGGSSGGGPNSHAALHAVREATLRDNPADPPVVILARAAGIETLCAGEGPAPGGDNDLAVREAARALAGVGARIFVVRLPTSSGLLESEDQELATIGGTDAPYLVGDAAELKSSLGALLGASVSCEVTLEGQVKPGHECDGDVYMEERVLPCNGPDGYRLKDARTIELMGDACEAFRSAPSAHVRASFPCGSYLL